MKPLAIDLFCGLGGWSEALINLGYFVVGFDIERHVYGAASHGSKSSARKAASALIAKIPTPLARHIGSVYWPAEQLERDEDYA